MSDYDTTPTDEPAAPKRSRWYPDTAAKKIGVVAVALLAIGGLANLSPDEDTEPIARVAGETVTTARHRPTAPPTSNATAELVTWISAHGHVLFDIVPILSEAEQAAYYAGETGDTSQLVAACDDFRDAIGAAQAAPPIPIASVDRPWQAALDSYSRFAIACSAGASSYDNELLIAAISYMHEGTAHLSAATSALEAAQS